MGQRSQCIVRLPDVKYGEDNPNNRKQQIRVYHNQWLFGANFVKWSSRFIKALEHQIKNRYGEFNHMDWDRALEAALGHANFADLDYITNTHQYDTDQLDYLKDFAKRKLSALEFLEEFDNNNGYLYVKIDDKGEVSFDILTGHEDADDVKSITPKGFVVRRYSRGDKTKEAKEECNHMVKLAVKEIEFLDKHKQISCLKDLDTFKKDIFTKKEYSQYKAEIFVEAI